MRDDFYLSVSAYIVNTGSSVVMTTFVEKPNLNSVSVLLTAIGAAIGQSHQVVRLAAQKGQLK
jgi:hypothetical protein